MTIRRNLRRVARVAVVGVATYWLALPQIARAWRGFGLLNDRGLLLPLVGALLAVGAVWAYAQVTRMLFDRDERPGSWLTLGIVVAALGVNRLVPAGTAAGSVVTFRLFGRTGVGGQRTGFVMATQGLGSNLILVLLVAVAMVMALPTHGMTPGYVTGAVIGTGLLALVVALSDGIWNRRHWLRATARRVGQALGYFWSGIGPSRMEELLESIRSQASQLASRPADAGSAIVWGTLNWLLDAGSLWVFLMMAGTHLAPHSVVLVFGLANLAALLPLTPGGLGVVDLTMTTALSALGVPTDVAVLGVAGYRLSHYWLPIPAAAFAYVLVRRHLSHRVRVGPALV